MPSGQLPVPLGRLEVTRGGLTAVRGRFERLAAGAWFTRKVSVLFPVAGIPEEACEAFTNSLQLQQRCYELGSVPLAALGDQAFAEAVRSFELCCLSRASRGLDSGNCIAVVPNELIAALEASAFQRLGLEEPATGARQLRKQLQPFGRKHVRIALGISKTRAKQASPTGAVSRWRSLVPEAELCSLTAYCGREAAEGPDFAALLGQGVESRCVDLPVYIRRFSLDGALGQRGIRPPLEDLVWRPNLWNDSSFVDSSMEVEQPMSEPENRGNARISTAYGEACEDLLEWLGALHLGVDPSRLALLLPGGLGDVNGPNRLAEDVHLWSLGEGLMGPSQVLHAVRKCIAGLESSSMPWFLLSMWGDEDAPISHHGGAHGFDLTGAHHAHLLAVRCPEGQGEVRCVMLEQANALHSRGDG